MQIMQAFISATPKGDAEELSRLRTDVEGISIGGGTRGTQAGADVDGLVLETRLT